MTQVHIHRYASGRVEITAKGFLYVGPADLKEYYWLNLLESIGIEVSVSKDEEEDDAWSEPEDEDVYGLGRDPEDEDE